MRLVLFGPPGAGKGTQARMLYERSGIPQVASGDLLRAAIREHNPRGLKARVYMDRGELVPDDLVLGMVEERLTRADAREGFILDGFPRNVAQAEALDRMLAGGGQALDRVIAMIVPDEEIVKRISGRRTCRNCSAMYHVIYDPPRNIDLCDKCSGELYQREDDAEDTVRMRLRVYAAATRPLRDYYGRRKLVAEIDGVGAPQDVQNRIVAALEGVLPARARAQVRA